MAGSKSKAKGNAGELQLCKILSSELGGSFVRVPQSGAFVGGRNSHRKATLSETQQKMHTGDIVPPDDLPRMVVEVKSYKDFRFHQLLQSGPQPILDSWISQTLTAVKPDDEWFVIFKINLRGWYVAVPQDRGYMMGNHAIYVSPSGPTTMAVTELNDFITNNKNRILERCRSK